MIELSVERAFCAAHAITIGGRREPVHGHNWQVTAVVRPARRANEGLDNNGLVCDFHAVERALDGVIAPFHNADLNSTPPFDRINPTAEHVARHIARTLQDKVPEGAVLHAVRITEAPGCAVTYYLGER
jgi:6-pyruvoyltetrahydropterin/6-carboxytetrahydropterin synthase